MSTTPCTICAPVAPKRPVSACKVVTRTGIGVKRFGFISCASLVDIFSLIGQSEATIYTALNTMLALDPEVIGYTGLLAATEFADPSTITEATADCLPAVESVGSRDITWNDFNGYDLNGSSVVTNYWEFDMYDTLNTNGSNYYYFYVDCNNDLWLFYRTVNGNYLPLAVSFYSYRAQEKTQAGNSTIVRQVIRAKLSFIGDPINMGVKPLVNLNNATGLLAELK